MALISCDFFSEALQVGTSMIVVLPQPTEEQIGVESADRAAADVPPPVLYLLHGLSDDHTAWTRYTSIERYATARGLAVVMPAVGRSFYADEARGHPYWRFVAHELPEVVASFFRVSTARDDTFVAGLSMGGYGALKLALTHPERFAAAASLSGVADIGLIRDRPERAELHERVFGNRIGDADDLFALLEAADPTALPPLFVACGHDEPMLLDANRRLAARARERGVHVTTDERPGEHEWSLWDAVVQDVVDWLPIRTARP